MQKHSGLFTTPAVHFRYQSKSTLISPINGMFSESRFIHSLILSSFFLAGGWWTFLLRYGGDKVVAQPDALTTQEPLSYVSLISHWPFFWLAICYNNQSWNLQNRILPFYRFDWSSYLRKSFSMNLLSLQRSCSSTSSSRGRGFKSSHHILKESGLSKGDKRTLVEEAGLYEKKCRQQGQTADSSADQGGKKPNS